MRTIKIPQQIIPEHEIKIYRFEELPEDIKNELLEKHINKLFYHGYNWEDELYHSMNTTCKNFGIGYEEDTYGNIWLTYPKDKNLETKTAEKMTGSRAIAYIENHFNFKVTPYIYKYGNTVAYWNKLTKIKERFDKKREQDKQSLKNFEEKLEYDKRNPYPNILRERYMKNEHDERTEYAYPISIAASKMEDNTPTGYCEDYQIIETYEEFKKHIKKNPETTSLDDFFNLLLKNYRNARDKEREYQESMEHLENDVYETTEFYEDGTIYKEKNEKKHAKLVLQQRTDHRPQRRNPRTPQKTNGMNIQELQRK